MNFFSLAKRINRPLILDGAIGSYLQSLKVIANGSLWMSYANIRSPEKVLQLHKDYIKAGADIITTNTFRTNPTALKNFSKINPEKLVKKSVALALKARENLPVFIAGSNAPAEDCYQDERTISKKELIYNHHKHINLLMDAGCDFILNETQSHFDEIKIICSYCNKKSIPYVISFFVKDDLHLLSGEYLFDVIKIVPDYEPLAIGFNCIKPETFEKLLSKINKDINWGFYLNCGSGNYEDEIIKCGISPIQYVEQVKSSLKKKPSFVGSCCGSSPSHIKEIKNLIDERNKN